MNVFRILNPLAGLWDSVPARFESDYSLDESVAQVSWLSKAVLNFFRKKDPNHIVLMNYPGRIFYSGHFVQENKKWVLCGRFAFGAYSRITLPLLLGFALIIALLATVCAVFLPDQQIFPLAAWGILLCFVVFIRFCLSWYWSYLPVMKDRIQKSLRKPGSISISLPPDNTRSAP